MLRARSSTRFAMVPTPIRFGKKALALLLALVLLCPTLPSQEQSEYLIHVQSDLVRVNVAGRAKSEKFVQGLKPENFAILEDNKPQKVVSFDVENVDAVPASDVAQAKPLPESAPAPEPAKPALSAAAAAW